MMPPQPLESNPSGPPDSEASYPTNPHSDLQPVPAAPSSAEYFDGEIPPISTDHDAFFGPPSEPIEPPPPIYEEEVPLTPPEVPDLEPPPRR